MNIYDVAILENEIEQIAKDNDGEIPEDKIKELVEVNTQSLVQVEKLCKYIKHLDLFMQSCNTEIERIKNLKTKAGNRIDSIKKYMTPFVKEKGRLDTGTFKLSTRRSERIDIDDSYMYTEYEKTKTTITIDKDQIKKDLKDGKSIQGAKITEHYNLQIK